MKNQFSMCRYAGLLFFCCFISDGFAANVTQVGRYMTVDNKPLTAQVNPLLAVQQIHFPQQIHTVGQAIKYWLQYSGFSMVNDEQLPDTLREVMKQPLPQVVRNLGPLTVQDGLEVLAGQQVFSLVQDPVHRRVGFRIKPQFAHLAQPSRGKRA